MTKPTDALYMRVTGVTVLIRAHGADEIHVDTDYPSPFPPSVSDGPLSLKSSARSGGGVEYAKQHFPGVPLTIIDMSTGERRTLEPC